MKYILTKEDYIYLYPFFTAEEIKEEFGSRSHSSRHIRRVYADAKLAPVRNKIKDFRDKSFAIWDFELDAAGWLGYVSEEIKEVKKEKSSYIWNRVKKYEELFTDAFRNC